MEKHFPEAIVDGFEPLMPQMTNDEKDRHVLAAAVHAGISLIVTFNIRDFPVQALTGWKIHATHPQDYLLTLYSMNPGVVLAKLAAIAQHTDSDLQDVLIRLGKTVADFAARLLDDMGENC